MVKWTKVNNVEEHRKLIEVWGKDIDSIECHVEKNRSYPFWFSDDYSRQSDNGWIEAEYPDSIISIEDVIGKREQEIVLW